MALLSAQLFLVSVFPFRQINIVPLDSSCLSPSKSHWFYFQTTSRTWALPSLPIATMSAQATAISCLGCYNSLLTPSSSSVYKACTTNLCSQQTDVLNVNEIMSLLYLKLSNGIWLHLEPNPNSSPQFLRIHAIPPLPTPFLLDFICYLFLLLIFQLYWPNFTSQNTSRFLPQGLCICWSHSLEEVSSICCCDWNFFNSQIKCSLLKLVFPDLASITGLHYFLHSTYHSMKLFHILLLCSPLGNVNSTKEGDYLSHSLNKPRIMQSRHVDSILRMNPQCTCKKG